MNRTLLLIFICFTTQIYGQKGSIFAELNFNTFSHSSLKKFQEEFREDIPEVQLRINDNFPANVGFTVGYHLDNIKTSFFVSYNTTGGKISYSDFSGLIRLKQPLKGYTVGGVYEHSLSEDDNFRIGFRGLVTYSDLKIQSNSTIGMFVNDEEIALNSIDFGGGAQLIYEYPISMIKLRATAGFDFVLGGKLLFKENSEVFIENNNGKAVRTGWTGLRLGLGIAIPI